LRYRDDNKILYMLNLLGLYRRSIVGRGAGNVRNKDRA